VLGSELALEFLVNSVTVMGEGVIWTVTPETTCSIPYASSLLVVTVKLPTTAEFGGLVKEFGIYRVMFVPKGMVFGTLITTEYPP
jgi:hypothetical protein